MSQNRFLLRTFLRCGQCSHVHRHNKGYVPIPNPILFNAEAQCRGYYDERRRSVGYKNELISTKCPHCGHLHADYEIVGLQDFIDQKLLVSSTKKHAQ